MQDFRKVEVWKNSHIQTVQLYKITSLFPKDELFGLTSQWRRAASSIPTNLAEGFGRNSNPQVIQFINIAIGSSQEVEYLLLLSKDLNYITEENFNNLSLEAGKIKAMLYNLIKKIEINYKIPNT